MEQSKGGITRKQFLLERQKLLEEHNHTLNELVTARKEINRLKSITSVINSEETELEQAALDYAKNHSSAPDKETPDWIITDFKAGAQWQQPQIIKLLEVTGCHNIIDSINYVVQLQTKITRLKAEVREFKKYEQLNQNK